MIDLYSNENFPIDTVIILRQLGYDVLTSYDAGQAKTLHHYLQSQDNLRNRLVRVQKQNQPKSGQKIFVVKEYNK